MEGSSKNLLLALIITISASVSVKSESELEPYEVVSGISGSISSIGSDTLSNLVTLWAEEFKRAYPAVNVQIQSAGSSTAPPALTEGTSSLGPMSRKMKDKELESFEARYGYKPTAVPVAIDALAVFVHKDNPIASLSMQEVDSIFSSTLRCGGDAIISTWGELGLSGAWMQRGIQLFGRNSVAGTYGYFKKQALCKGDFKNKVNEQPGSASVVQSVSTSINAIGYSGMGYKTSSVRTVPLSRGDGSTVDATAANAVTGSYPLSRFLYIYINKNPNSELPPLVREFLNLIYSNQGQEIVAKDGYVSLPASVVGRFSEKLGLK